MIARPQVVAFDGIETPFSLDASTPGSRTLACPRRLWTFGLPDLRDAFAFAALKAYAPFRDVQAAA